MHKILTPAERSALKARAHPLRPVVMIGAEGLSATVLQEIDNSLKAHELIKIKVDSDDQDERDDLMGTICANTGASAIQHIGKILVVFRERPQSARKAAEGGGKARKPGGGAARGAKPGGNASGGGGGGGSGGGNRPAAKAGKGGPVWTKVRAKKQQRRNKPRKAAEG